MFTLLSLTFSYVGVLPYQVEVAFDEDGVRLESKAAALSKPLQKADASQTRLRLLPHVATDRLNLVSHGAFASRPDAMPSPSKTGTVKAAKGIFSALSRGAPRNTFLIICKKDTDLFFFPQVTWRKAHRERIRQVMRCIYLWTDILLHSPG